MFQQLSRIHPFHELVTHLGVIGVQPALPINLGRLTLSQLRIIVGACASGRTAIGTPEYSSSDLFGGFYPHSTLAAGSTLSIPSQVAFVSTEHPLGDRALLIVNALALVAFHSLARLRSENLNVDVAIFPA
jgi:hypothetical protein